MIAAPTSKPRKAQPPTAREQRLIDAMRSILLETMDYPPYRPFSGESSLPDHLWDRGQRALEDYDMCVVPNRGEVAA